MLILITGGSKQGKSHLAENILTAQKKEHMFYIATMEPYGEEAEAAIRRHRAVRCGKGFETIEQYTDIQELALPDNSAVLLECAGNLCANEMFSAGCIHAADKIIRGVRTLLKTGAAIVIVTNQVGDEAVDYESGTMEYIRQMGLLNQGLAQIADCVIEAVYGIPVVQKGKEVASICVL